MEKIKTILLLFIISTLVITGQLSAQSSGTSRAVKWQFKTSARIQATPLISDNILYIGSFDSCFYALDLKTGTEKWHYKTQNQIFSTPVKFNDILCFESGNVLYGVNLTGELVWKFVMYDGPFLNQNDEWDYYHSSPVLADSIIYCGSEKGLVFGVNARTGEKVFQCQTPSANFTIETTPAVYDNKIYFGDWDGVFFAYDLTSQQMVWSYDTKKDYSSTSWVNAIVTDPVIINGEVFFGGRSCNLYCVDAVTGTKKWHIHDPLGDMWIVGGPTISNGAIFLGSSYQHVVREFSAANGKQIWSCDISYRSNGKPTLFDNYVIAGTEHDTDDKIGGLVLINKSNGQLISKLNVGAQVYSTPVINDSIIYFGATNGYVYAVKFDALVNVPNITTKPLNIINCGKHFNNAKFDTTMYVYNSGVIADSISITSDCSQAVFSPSNFIVAAKDSQKITITVNPTGLSAPKTYSYNVSIVSTKSPSVTTFPKILRFVLQAVPSGVNNEQSKIETFELEQNFPNPFNPETTIKYQVPECSQVELKVFNILGSEVATLINEFQNPGEYSVKFNSASYSGLSSGIYFYRLKAGSFSKIYKMMLMK